MTLGVGPFRKIHENHPGGAAVAWQSHPTARGPVPSPGAKTRCRDKQEIHSAARVLQGREDAEGGH